MNKEEIEAKLHNYEERLKDIAKAIEETRQQLDEKPKYRHGDFGLWKYRPTTDPRNAIYINKHLVKDTIYTNIAEWCSNASDDDGRELTVFGNIFDLMRSWGRDLTKFELDVHKYFIDERADMSHAPIHIAGNWHTETEAYKFWCNLGQMLMTLKRKKNK